MQHPVERTGLPIRSLNHISFVCRDAEASGLFYETLGFFRIARPASLELKCEGVWLFNYGIGIHLLQADESGQPAAHKPRPLNPRADHLSFQSDSLSLVEERLSSLGVEYIKEHVFEGGIKVTQIFFHDPDANMIEICNCDCLPILPLSACAMSLNAQPAAIACPAENSFHSRQAPGIYQQQHRPVHAPIGGSA